MRDEKDPEGVLAAKGIAKERIRKYGFAFRGKGEFWKKSTRDKVIITGIEWKEMGFPLYAASKQSEREQRKEGESTDEKRKSYTTKDCKSLLWDERSAYMHGVGHKKPCGFKGVSYGRRKK